MLFVTLFTVGFHLSVDLSSGRLSVSWSPVCLFSLCRLVFRPSVCLLVVCLSSTVPLSFFFLPAFCHVSCFKFISRPSFCIWPCVCRLPAVCLSSVCLSACLSAACLSVCLQDPERLYVGLPACLCKTIIFFLHPFAQSVSLSIYLSVSSNPCVHLGTCCVACTLTRHPLPVWVRWVRQAGSFLVATLVKEGWHSSRGPLP